MVVVVVVVVHVCVHARDCVRHDQQILLSIFPNVSHVLGNTTSIPLYLALQQDSVKVKLSSLFQPKDIRPNPIQSNPWMDPIRAQLWDA